MSLFLLFSFLSFCTLLPLQAQEQSGLSFEAVSHDFGTIKEQDGAVRYTFQFVNRTPRPIVIRRIYAPCGCTTPDFDRQPVLPGCSSEIRVIFDPSGREGKFEKKLWISSSDNQEYQLTVCGTIIRSSPRFPIQLGSGLVSNSRSADLGLIPQGGNYEHLFILHNTTDTTLQLAACKAKGSHLHVLCPPRLAPGATDTLRLNYDLRTKSVWGTLQDTVRLFVNGKPALASFSLIAQAIDAPKTGDISPVIEIAQRNIVINGRVQDTLRHNFVVRNLGPGVLQVRHAECRGSARFEVDPSGTVVEAQKAATIRLLLPPGIRRRTAVTLFTNDPATPILRLRLQAQD